MSGETLGGNQSPRSLQAQAELTRRFMESFRKADRSTTRYTLILAIFAMIQIVVAMCQMLFDFETSGHFLISLGVVLLCAISIVAILTGLDPDKILRD